MKVKIIDISASDIMIIISSLLLVLFPLIVLFSIPEDILPSIPESTLFIIAIGSSLSFISGLLLSVVHFMEIGDK